MLERDSRTVDKMVTIESKISGITFVMSDDETIDLCLIKFKNIPVMYPIQSAFDSPYVFDDDKEVCTEKKYS